MGISQKSADCCKDSKFLSANENFSMLEKINQRYKVIKKLGEGGMGTVFLVSDQLTSNQQMALKQINKQVLNDNTLNIFKQEFEVMTRLKHPHLVRVFDFSFDISQDIYFITMEYIQGPSLTNLVTKNTRLTSEQVITIFIDICRALSFIHSRNIIHHDINPNNIMINNDGMVKLMDFGLAEIGSGDKKRKGTLAYMAPEIIKGVTGPCLDIFALGITLFELVTNERFYQGNSSQFIVSMLGDINQGEQYQEKRLTKLSDWRMKHIIHQMIDYNPNQRYQTCTDIIVDINKTYNINHELETATTREAYVLGAGFVGRDKELSILTNKLEKPELKCRILWVKGDVGVGKTRLFSEFRNWCQLHQVIFLEGSCYEEIHQAFGPFLPIINELLLHIDDSQKATFGPELKKIFPHHAVLDSVTVGQVYDPQTERINLVRTIVQCLMAFTTNFKDQECVIYLNDMHWSDEASIEVVNHLMEEIKIRFTSTGDHAIPFHFYMTSRFENIEALENIPNKEQFEVIILSPFHESVVQNYLEAVFGTNALSPELYNAIPTIRQKVGGNPFYLQELIKSLIDNKIIIRQEKNWNLIQSLTSLKIPMDLETLVRSRLDNLQLDQDELEVLQIIALLNRKTNWAEINSMVSVKSNLLTKMEQVEILKRELQRDRYEYLIAHDLIREVIIETIQQRQTLHERIAKHLEELHKHTPGNYIEELAHHYLNAGNQHKALEYLDCAAKQAESLFETEKTITYYTTSFDLLSPADSQQKITLLLAKATIYLNIGKIPESMQCCQQAGELAESEKHYTLAAKAYWLLSHCYFEIYDSRCEAMVEKSLHMSRLAKNQDFLPACFNVLGLFNFQVTKDYHKAIECYNKGILIARTNKSKTGLAANICNISHVFHALGDFDKAIKYVKEGLQLYGDITDRQRDRAIAIGYLGEYHASNENYNAAFDCFNQGLHLCEKTSSISSQIEIQTKMMGTFFKLKRFDEAQELCDIVGTNIHKTFEYGVIFAYKILAAKLKYVFGDHELAQLNLKKMLEKSILQYEIAELNYELWRMNREMSYHNTALSLYQELIKKTPDYIYKKRLKHLQDSQAEYNHNT